MASLQVLNGFGAGSLQELSKAETVIGRRPDCDVVVPLDTVSRRHAVIHRRDDGFYIEDLQSTNGTIVNGNRIEGPTRLRDRDLVRIEGVVLRFLQEPSHDRALDSAPNAAADDAVKMPTIFATLDVWEPEQRVEVRPEAKLRAMLQIIRSLDSSLEIEEVLPKILEALMGIFPQAERAYILLAEGRELKLRALRQRDEYDDKSLTMRPISRTVAQRVMADGTAMLSGDAADDQRLQASQSVFTSEIHSVMCAPLKGTDQQPLGVIQVDTRDTAQPFDQEDLDVLASVAFLAGLAVERSRAHEVHLQTARLAAIGQTVASIAHESRNALHSLALGLKVLEQGAQARPEDLEMIHLMQRDQEQLQQLLEEVRGYAAPIKLDCQGCNLSEVWRAAWDQLAPQRQGRQVHLHQQADDVDLQCVVDPSRLAQVFRNLIENALAACNDPVHIDVVCAPAALDGADALRIAVRDNGPGMNDEQREQAFEAFYTTRSEGTGLGLAIVRRIVEAHGGQIHVGREGWPGAEFIILLPRKAGAKQGDT